MPSGVRKALICAVSGSISSAMGMASGVSSRGTFSSSGAGGVSGETSRTRIFVGLGFVASAFNASASANVPSTSIAASISPAPRIACLFSAVSATGWTSVGVSCNTAVVVTIPDITRYITRFIMTIFSFE